MPIGWLSQLYIYIYISLYLADLSRPIAPPIFPVAKLGSTRPKKLLDCLRIACVLSCPSGLPRLDLSVRPPKTSNRRLLIKSLPGTLWSAWPTPLAQWSTAPLSQLRHRANEHESVQVRRVKREEQMWWVQALKTGEVIGAFPVRV